jgi:VCBS repeat-containing protein
MTRRDNPDGSRTYLIDVRNVPAGTAANLSFDLIGFAGSGSHVTVRDVRLIGWPQPQDDVAETAEDTALVIDAASNDIDADQSGFTLTVAAAPAHGQVNVEADGTFRYVPEADYFGSDSFTYRFTNGLVDSNIATVNLTITAVNDAPVAPSLDMATAEDTPLVLDLLAGASDVEGLPLTAVVVTGPAHGSLTQTSEGTWAYTPDADY